MITIMNRKTVYLGTDMKKFSQILDTLSASGIPYKYKVSNPMGKWSAPGAGVIRSQTGGLGLNGKPVPDTYEIYVHRDDYEKAGYLLRNL